MSTCATWPLPDRTSTISPDIPACSSPARPTCGSSRTNSTGKMCGRRKPISAPGNVRLSSSSASTRSPGPPRKPPGGSLAAESAIRSWACFSNGSCMATTSVTKDRLEQVIGAARRLSGGPYARWQDLLDREDVAGLVAFASSPDGLAFPPRLVAALARDLTAARQLPACLKYLRAATDRYPQDAWLHFALFGVCTQDRAIRVHRELAAHCGGVRSTAQQRLVSPPARRLLLGTTGVRSGSIVLSEVDSRSTPIRSSRTTGWERPWQRRRTKRGRWRRSRNHSVSIRKTPWRSCIWTKGLVALGRPADALHEIVDAFGRFPTWADDPRLYLRYGAACAAMNCADGKGSPPVPVADRPSFRKQALDLLNADLAELTKLAASDREFVHQDLQHGSRTSTWRASDLQKPPAFRPKKEFVGKRTGPRSSR